MILWALMTFTKDLPMDKHQQSVTVECSFYMYINVKRRKHPCLTMLLGGALTQPYDMTIYIIITAVYGFLIVAIILCVKSVGTRISSTRRTEDVLLQSPGDMASHNPPAHACVLQENRHYLCQTLDVKQSLLLEKLQSLLLLPTAVVELIQATPVTKECVNLVIDHMSKRTTDDFKLFLHALDETNQRHIVKKLCQAMKRRIEGYDYSALTSDEAALRQQNEHLGEEILQKKSMLNDTNRMIAEREDELKTLTSQVEILSSEQNLLKRQNKLVETEIHQTAGTSVFSETTKPLEKKEKAINTLETDVRTLSASTWLSKNKSHMTEKATTSMTLSYRRTSKDAKRWLKFDQNVSTIYPHIRNPGYLVPVEDNGFIVAGWVPQGSYVQRVDRHGQMKGEPITFTSRIGKQSHLVVDVPTTITALCFAGESLIVMTRNGVISHWYLSDFNYEIHRCKVDVGRLQGGDFIAPGTIVFCDSKRGCVCTYQLSTMRQDVVVSELQKPESIVHSRTSKGPVFILIEKGKCEVHVYDHAWKRHSTIGPWVPGNKRLYDPRYALMSKHETILVFDYKGRICEFTVTGDFIGDVSMQPERILKHPFYAATRDDYIWVIQNDDKWPLKSTEIYRFKYANK